MAEQWELGVRHLEGRGLSRDYEKAEQWLRKAAEQGHARAQYQLGRLYDKGQGVTQDYPGAAAWYRKAAEQGIAAAANNLGNLYRDGKGVEQDYEAALSWYRKAIVRGDVAAQANLGIMYEAGLGVTRDTRQASIWLQKAAKRGSSKAREKLRVMQESSRAVTGVASREVTARSLARHAPEVAPVKVRSFRHGGTAQVGSKWRSRRTQTASAAARRPKQRMATPPQPESVQPAGEATTDKRLRVIPVVAAPQGEASAPVAEQEVAPVVQEVAPVVQEAAPVVQEAAPVVQEAAPVVQEAAPVMQSVPDSAPAPAELVQAQVQELVPVSVPVSVPAQESERAAVSMHFQRLDGDEPGVVRGGAMEQELLDPQHGSRVPFTPQQQLILSRYVDNGNGTITDHRRKLVGLKNANCFGRRKWQEAMAAVQDLSSGQCQLTDESRSGEWRMPSMSEMHILLDWQESGLFDNVQTIYYWSGTAHEANPDHYWYLSPVKGMLYNGSQERRNAVWPVRALRK
ncbi:MAG: DUF1566 domain-containing protein [Magnetococcus sp. YQC-3]